MSKKNLIVYVHGWNSHANARKAQLLQNELKDHDQFVLFLMNKIKPGLDYNIEVKMNTVRPDLYLSVKK